MPIRLMDGEYLRRHLSINSLDDPGCWEWKGNQFRDGYGVACRNGRNGGAHRFVYELLIGPIPRGLQIDHLCRNRLCVNPTHLEPVTKRENILRGISPQADNAKKTHCLKGHIYSEENIYLRYGSRYCRQCHADQYRNLSPEKRAAILLARKAYYQNVGKAKEKERRARAKI